MIRYYLNSLGGLVGIHSMFLYSKSIEYEKRILESKNIKNLPLVCNCMLGATVGFLFPKVTIFLFVLDTI
jgi:hypothetical protein